MTVFFAIRHDYLTCRGGDTTQMLKTKEALESSYNITIIIITSSKELNAAKSGDILHVFNIQTQQFSLEMVREGKKRGMRIVLSPIYWDLTDAICVTKYYRHFSFVNAHFIHLFKPYFKHHNNPYLSQEYISSAREILKNSDIILPNSEEEYEILIKHFGIEVQHVVVPNAIEAKNNPSSKKWKDREGVLIVGRIEPTKNQLAVVQALFQDREIPITIVGKQITRKYCEPLIELSEKRGNVRIIEEVSHDTINDYYSAAKVHVLASFRESPGLATLEALHNKARVVVSNEKYCPIHYYQLDRLSYICNPYSLRSIRRAILTAYYDPDVEDSFDWHSYWAFFSYENAGNITYNAYNMLKS